MVALLKKGKSNMKNGLNIAVFLDFEVSISRREGIMVYAGYLLDAFLRNGAILEIWLYSANKQNFENAFKEELELYRDKIHVFTEEDGTLKRRGNCQSFIKWKLWRIISRLCGRIGLIGVEEWFSIRSVNHKIIYEKSCYDMKTAFTALSKAKVAYVPFPGLKEAQRINIPAVVQIHDLFTLPLQALFNREYFPRTNYAKNNKKLVKVVDGYAKKNATFVSSTEYTINTQILPYIKNAKKQNCEAVIFPSMLSKCDLTKLNNRDWFIEKYKLPKHYLAFPSQNRPNKNIITLLKAIKELRDRGHEFTLVTTGKMSDCNSTMAFNKVNPGLVMEIGSISLEDLYCLYSYAECVACPNLIEGMGISGQCLEAIYAGTPVTHAKSMGIVESLDKVGLKYDDVCLYWFEVDDYKKLADNILEIVEKREEVILKQKSVLEAYEKRSWDDVANDYFHIFEKIIQGN